ncbi:MAG: hydrogenase small subunit, partial [Desulfuromonadales bacterium]|nr:hydrogenase small subunit [Desulfuromonadales bacterium]
MKTDLDVVAPPIPEEILQRMEAKGINRRDFIKFCTATTAALALPVSFIPTVAQAIEDKRPPVIWAEYQSCSGDSEAFLRANQPTAGEIILDLLSIEYAEVLMAAAGHQAEEAKHQAMEKYKGQYILIVEGSIPTGAGGGYCTIGGHSAVDDCKKLVQNAAATICVGSCSS